MAAPETQIHEALDLCPLSPSWGRLIKAKNLQGYIK